MGTSSRRKGAAAEREAASLAQSFGLSCRRTWEKAQSSDPAERRCDIEIGGRPYQVKRQRDGFRALYDGLRDVAGLFLRSDNREWLCVVRASNYLELLSKWRHVHNPKP